MIRTLINSLVLPGIIIILVRCESPQLNLTETPENTQNTDISTVTGSMTDVSECKQFKTGNSLSELSDTISCIEYSFNAGDSILTLKHLNAGFNCCPDSLFCSVNTHGDSLIIQEFEASALCRCNCLYDLEIKIEGIEARSYQVKFIEPYADEMEELIFEIDLTVENTGSYCVIRKTYPWGVFDGQEEQTEITGKLVSHSDCKSSSSEMQISKEFSSNESCIEYSYDPETNKLAMKHINAAFNCCPEDINCTSSTTGDTIFVRETEANGLCNCLCLFDLDIELSGLLTRPYFIKIIEPYLDKDEKLVFEIDLGERTSGSYCVTREQYPWGI